MKRLVLAVLMSVILCASAVGASTDTANEDRGSIGVFYPHISFRGDDQPDTGDGAGIRIGGMKGKVFGAFLSAFRTRHDDGPGRKAEFTGLTGDLKLSMPLFKVVAPYVCAGIGRYVLETPDTVLRGNQEGSGINGYQVGAGLWPICARTANHLSLRATVC